MKVTEKQISNFWKKVLKIDGGCWEWQGSRLPSGYGTIHLRGCGENENHRAHRLSWFLHFGIIPDGMMVLHKCDNTRCCNPAHLFLGSNLDNMLDMVKKGRHSKALMNPDKQKEISELAKSSSAREKKKNNMIKNKHQQGERNSNYGTCWLTNGCENIKWKDSKGKFPDGFSKGRTIKSKL